MGWRTNGIPMVKNFLPPYGTGEFFGSGAVNVSSTDIWGIKDLTGPSRLIASSCVVTMRSTDEHFLFDHR